MDFFLGVHYLAAIGKHNTPLATTAMSKEWDDETLTVSMKQSHPKRRDFFDDE